jgi:uncharacterized protein YjbI with pentapeptide repeats
MRLTTLFLFVALVATSAHAASYQTTDGTIVDPIQMVYAYMGDHPYSGNNLEPGATLIGANLIRAFLPRANLTGANLAGANLTGAYLTDANLTDAWLGHASLPYADLYHADLFHAALSLADLTNVNLNDADLTDAILTDAILTNVNLSGSDLSSVYGSYWSTAHWTDAHYYTDSEPDWHSDMDQAWRDSAGILAIDPTGGDFNSDGVFDAADYTVARLDGSDAPSLLPLQAAMAAA